MTIIGFCNPLLDITLNNHPSIPSLLSKFNLKDNDIILAAAGHDELVKQMIELGVEYSAGGAGLNSLRCAQSMLEPNTCRIVGSIGTDHFAQILLEKSHESHLLTNFQTTSPKPTGKCACLIHGPHRSLVAYLGAANDFSADHLDGLKKEIKNADFLYVTGFFYSVSPASVKRILAYKTPKSKLIFNLSATFVPDMIDTSDFDSIMESCYMLVGNSDEFSHLNRRLDAQISDYKQFAMELSTKYPECIVLVTQGSDPIILLQSGKLSLIPVPPLPAELIVDTNGAGDAFAGGILGSLEKQSTIEEAIQAGCAMAAEIIKQPGIQPPKNQQLK